MTTPVLGLTENTDQSFREAFKLTNDPVAAAILVLANSVAVTAPHAMREALIAVLKEACFTIKQKDNPQPRNPATAF